MSKKILFTMLAMALVFSTALTGCDDGSGGNNNETTQGTPAAPQPFNNITAAQLVANIKISWNLGNSLDATPWPGETWFPSDIAGMEKAWGNPVTTKANITAIKNAGFNAIRILVSWTKAADSNYTIRTDWMNRVVEVVNYAVDNDMYILLNTHHDDETFTLMNSNAAAGQAAFRKIWEQIADTFKNYNEKLVFEALNEPRTIGSANEWAGGTAEERSNLNKYYQIFVDTVRASGGNNGKRILQINTYAASVEVNAINGLILPTDTVANKLIVSVHHYAPWSYCSDSPHIIWDASNANEVEQITEPIDRTYNVFASKGIPVIIGEFGAPNKNNEANRAVWAKFYVDYAWKKGIKCFMWDNGAFSENQLINRNNNTFPFPQIISGLMFTLGDSTETANYWTELIADDGSKPYFPTVTANTVYTDTKTLTATTSASSTSADANQFVFNIGENTGAASPPTLTFTTLTLVKN